VRRLAAVDWLLLGSLLPICLFGVVMTVVHGVRGDFVRPPFGVGPAPDGQYPIVWWVSPSSAGGAAVEVGDRVVRVEGTDLRGVSEAGYILRRDAAQPGTRSLLFTIEHGGVRADVRVPLVPGGYGLPGVPWWAGLPFILGLVGTSLLLLVRAAHWHLARRFYVASLLAALWATPFFSSPTAPWAEIIGNVLLGPLAFGLTAWNLFEFVPGLQLWGQWQRVAVWSLSLLLSANVVAFYWLPDAGLAAVLNRLGGNAFRSGGFASIGLFTTWLMALAQAYRRSDSLGRRQIKWVVYGFYLGTFLMVVDAAVNLLRVFPEWVGVVRTAAVLAAVAIPLGLLVAVAFYQFLDIDRLFSATLSYSVLAIVGLAVVLGVMPTASRAASDALGLDPATAQILLAVALAAALVPADQIVRPQIDRLLFPERLTLQQGFDQLLAAIAGCTDTEALTTLVDERLEALLRPASTVLYARRGEVYTPMTVRGRTARPPSPRTAA
jgi:hypothetical protein